MAILKNPIKCDCTICGKLFIRTRNRGSLTECTPCQSNMRVIIWKAANPQRAKEINTQPSVGSKKRYAASSRGMEVARRKAVKHYHKDIEASRWKNRARYAANRDEHIQRTIRRLKRLKSATPQWADHCEIDMIYMKARAISRQTGIEHQVDHVIPLKGKYVCGLHVAQNLQILTAYENLRKGNA